MSRVYQRKYLNDGVTINPRWKPDTRERAKSQKRTPEGWERKKETDKARRRDFAPGRLLPYQRPLFGWDGEGANFETGEPHRYILLNCREERRNSIGDFPTAGQLTGHYQDSQLVDASGISTAKALSFLARRLEAQSHGINVGFFFSYDVNMMLRDLPEALLRQLHRTGETWWRAFRIEYRPRKSFAVSERVPQWTGEDFQGWEMIGGRIWDVFGFFQSSFVDALDKYQTIDPGTIEQIRLMKAQRSIFRPEELVEIAEYCNLECEALARLMRQVLESHAGAGLHLTRFDGAGASAAALLRREKVKSMMGPRSGEWPEEVRDASQFAYGGGRIELFQFGHHKGPIYRYDLRSAYPAAMVNLPCLKCGGWSRITDPKGYGDSDFQMVRIEWDLRMRDPRSQEMFPFFWRAHDGRIYYPPQGAGWYWSPEISAGLRGLADGHWTGRITIRETRTYLTPCDHRPFAFVPVSFAERIRLKKSGDGAEKALKLALNAMYGRCAMRVGSRDGKPPGSHQIEWAGYTTSLTRAWILTQAIEAAATGHLVMLATDGIFTTRSLPIESAGLGGWEESVFESGTFVQSGVYWIGKGKDEAVYYRGFDRGSLTRAAVLAAWKAKERALLCPLTRFITLGRGLASKSYRDTWRTWKAENRELELVPSGQMKREARITASARPHLRLYPTVPVQPFLGSVFSSASALPWRRLAGAKRGDWDDLDDTIAGAE